ncbi:hypothetical protein L195_g060166 [Trifolium pratense]|uniref:Uncharacterized protein n=1 Tax=Trifolium pratense TaxID=57577 RepID=A0A2K3K2B2_TRIPR|nr:hypothetical protein L195_g060166 [Trifolium pratense]
MISGKLDLITKCATYSGGCVGVSADAGSLDTTLCRIPRMLVGCRPVIVAVECSLPAWDNRRQGVSNVQNRGQCNDRTGCIVILVHLA